MKHAAKVAAGRAHRGATRGRWLLAVAAVWLWFIAAPPTGILTLCAGLTVVVIAHRLLAPPPLRRHRRSTLRARVMVTMVAGILFAVASPPVWADVPSGDACRAAPTPETTGGGITGLLDPQNNLPLDGTVYGDRGYAGMFWHAYDTGCAAAIGQSVLGPVGGIAGEAIGKSTNGFDATNANADTMVGNLLLKASKLELAFVTGMRARALNPNYFEGFDGIVAAGVNGIQNLLITPWIGLPMVALGLILLGLARRGDAPQTAHRLMVAVAGLGIVAFLGSYPLQFSKWADSSIVGLQTGFDRGFLSRLPESITPMRYQCDYDMSQFRLPPQWTGGAQVIQGTACTVTYRPTLNADEKWAKGKDGITRNYEPGYFASGEYYPEAMLANLIFPYWQEGIIGSNDRSGPNYELALTFLRGQSVTKYDTMANDYFLFAAKNAPPDALWCTYENNARACGRAKNGVTPDKIMSATEATYRDAITLAGDQRYPFIQGKAGNRMSAGGTALAAVTAVAPTQGAAYTGVFAGRLLLRIFTFAGLISALGLLLFPRLLRRIANTVMSAAATVLLLSVLGSLMSFLTLELTANPAVFGTITPAGGLVILAVISVLMWLAIRPMRRIGMMLSTAAMGNPMALSNARRHTTGKVRGVFRRHGRHTTADSQGQEFQHSDRRDRSEGTDEGGHQEHRPRPESLGARTAPAAAVTQASQPATTRWTKSSTTQPHPEASRLPTAPDRSQRAWSEASDDAQITRPEIPSTVERSPQRPAARALTQTSLHTQLQRRPDASAPARRPVDSPAPSDLQMAPRSDTGAYVISDVARHDIFRPSQHRPGAHHDEPAYRARNRPRRSEIRELIWRPPPRSLPPAPPAAAPARRPEFASADSGA